MRLSSKKVQIVLALMCQTFLAVSPLLKLEQKLFDLFRKPLNYISKVFESKAAKFHGLHLQSNL